MSNLPGVLVWPVLLSARVWLEMPGVCLVLSVRGLPGMLFPLLAPLMYQVRD